MIYLHTNGIDAIRNLCYKPYLVEHWHPKNKYLQLCLGKENFRITWASSLRGSVESVILYGV